MSSYHSGLDRCIVQMLISRTVHNTGYICKYGLRRGAGPVHFLHHISLIIVQHGSYYADSPVRRLDLDAALRSSIASHQPSQEYMHLVRHQVCGVSCHNACVLLQLPSRQVSMIKSLR